jgi:DNA-binding response OmpR family regulator
MAKGGALHVLVTEDDPDLRGALVELLESEAIEATCVSTIEEARRALAARPEAVLLLDLHLGRGQRTAVDWLHDFGERRDAPRTLILSASVQGRVVAERFGVTFVPKPFDFDELVEQIRRVRDRDDRPCDCCPGPS